MWEAEEVGVDGEGVRDLRWDGDVVDLRVR